MDLASGDIVSDTEKVEIQLVGHDLPAVYGYSVNVAYDPEALSFDNTSFKPGSFIAGLIPLLLPEEGSVEVGGALVRDPAQAVAGPLARREQRTERLAEVLVLESVGREVVHGE